MCGDFVAGAFLKVTNQHWLLHLPGRLVEAAAGKQAQTAFESIRPPASWGLCPLSSGAFAALPKSRSERRHKLADVKRTAAWQLDFAAIKMKRFSQFCLMPKTLPEPSRPKIAPNTRLTYKHHQGPSSGTHLP